MFDKRLFVTVIAIALVMVGSATLVSLPPDEPAAPLHENVSGVEKESQTGAESSQPPQPEYEYIVREYMGRVAVFSRGDEENPDTVFDTLVKYLPDYDRSQMQEGIYVKDYEELVALIEDFVS